MNVFAHHEALLIGQATAGSTVAGSGAAALSSWTKWKARLDTRRKSRSGSFGSLE